MQAAAAFSIDEKSVGLVRLAWMMPMPAALALRARGGAKR
jgi:hypothetical protein